MTLNDAIQMLLLVLVLAASCIVLPVEVNAGKPSLDNAVSTTSAVEFAAGGNGRSPKTAIMFPDTADKVEGVVKERNWLDQYYPGHRHLMQSLMVHEERVYDRVSLTDKEGNAMIIYFDITDWWER